MMTVSTDLTKNILILNDFFPLLNVMEEELKSIPLYVCEDHPEHVNLSEQESSWPGKRSENLLETSKILSALFLQTLQSRVAFSKNFYPTLYIHLRDESCEGTDWIHTDENLLSVLVYLSDTNLNSGTGFFEGETLIDKVSFVKNRAVVFPGSMRHMSLGNHGEGIKTGRLTLNAFLHER